MAEIAARLKEAMLHNDPSFMGELGHLLMKHKGQRKTRKSQRRMMKDHAPPPPATPPPNPPPAAVATGMGPGFSTPPVPTLTKKAKTKHLIPLDERAFCFHNDGTICGAGQMARGSSCVKAQSRAVKKMAEAVNNPNCSDKQNVLALRKATTHQSARRIFRSAGLIDTSQFDDMKHHLGQIRKLVKEATATTSVGERAPDQQRAVVRALVMTMASTPTTDNEPPSERKFPSARQLFETVGLSQSTGCKILKAVSGKRGAIMDKEKESDWTLISTRKGFWQKVPEELRTEIDSWIRHHEHVIHSPIAKDVVWVKEKGRERERRSKLILQIPIRELHWDLHKSELRDKIFVDGKHLISDTQLGQLPPKELREIAPNMQQVWLA